MKAVIAPSKAEGSVSAPPSKSMAHRYLIAGALSKGKSIIHNIELSKDIDATLSCLRALGIDAEYSGDSVMLDGTLAPSDGAVLDCNESGSTLRFMIPICLTTGKRLTLTGTDKLFSRPLSVYEDICRKYGFDYDKSGNRLTVKGCLTPDVYEIPGDISSQFVTGMLFALTLLGRDSKLRLTGKTESRPYIDMTLQVLRECGADVTWTGTNELMIKGGREYRPGEYYVEGDCSNAAFLEAYNYLGSHVEVSGLRKDTLQGDIRYREFFPLLCETSPEIDISDCPDLGPILIAMAAACNGAHFVGTARLEIKESNRGEAMKAELAKMGVNITVSADEIIVPKSTLHCPAEPIDGHNDHRIVMAMATLLTMSGGEIEGAQAVSKSYPNYFKSIKQLGIDVETKE